MRDEPRAKQQPANSILGPLPVEEPSCKHSNLFISINSSITVPSWSVLSPCCAHANHHITQLDSASKNSVYLFFYRLQKSMMIIYCHFPDLYYIYSNSFHFPKTIRIPSFIKWHILHQDHYLCGLSHTPINDKIML